mmetsp:Transcript_23819/g.66992  ORF Transcript_23819/g.66992 Transcript_23819/m.66992 type:complete len:679 (+) Transcript_23819:98-2134(+)
MPPAGQWKPSYDLNHFGSSKVNFDHRAGKTFPRQGGIRLPVRTGGTYDASLSRQPSSVNAGMRLPPVSGPQGGYGYGLAGVAPPNGAPAIEAGGKHGGVSAGARSPDGSVPHGGIGFGKELLEIIREMREQLATQQRQITMLTHEVRSDAAADLRAELEQLKRQHDQKEASASNVSPGVDPTEVAELRELVRMTQLECNQLRARVVELEARPVALPASSTPEVTETRRLNVPPRGEVEEIDESDADSLPSPDVYEGTKEAEIRAGLEAAEQRKRQQAEMTPSLDTAMSTDAQALITLDTALAPNVQMPMAGVPMDICAADEAKEIANAEVDEIDMLVAGSKEPPAEAEAPLVEMQELEATADKLATNFEEAAAWSMAETEPQEPVVEHEGSATNQEEPASQAETPVSEAEALAGETVDPAANANEFAVGARELASQTKITAQAPPTEAGVEDPGAEHEIPAAEAEASATGSKEVDAGAEEPAELAEQPTSKSKELAVEPLQSGVEAEEPAEAVEPAAEVEEPVAEAEAAAAEYPAAAAEEPAVEAEEPAAEAEEPAAEAEEKAAEAEEPAVEAEEAAAEADELAAEVEKKEGLAATEPEEKAESEERAATAEEPVATADEPAAVVELAALDEDTTHVAEEPTLAAEKQANETQENTAEDDEPAAQVEEPAAQAEKPAV